MDYEVFLVTRMREAWDELGDNTRAVAHGLERTGRIVTAAAIIMVAAFSGFIAGRIAGLQEFGLGLAVAIFIDATVIRALLVPSLMAVLGRWNWWLPAPVARLVGVAASPLAQPTRAGSSGPASLESRRSRRRRVRPRPPLPRSQPVATFSEEEAMAHTRSVPGATTRQSPAQLTRRGQAR